MVPPRGEGWERGVSFYEAIAFVLNTFRVLIYYDAVPHLPSACRFEAGPRIPGSVYVDMDDVSAKGDLFPDLNPKGLPHMLPPKVSAV